MSIKLDILHEKEHFLLYNRILVYFFCAKEFDFISKIYFHEFLYNISEIPCYVSNNFCYWKSNLGMTIITEVKK